MRLNPAVAWTMTAHYRLNRECFYAVRISQARARLPLRPAIKWKMNGPRENLGWLLFRSDERSFVLGLFPLLAIVGFVTHKTLRFLLGPCHANLRSKESWSNFARKRWFAVQPVWLSFSLARKSRKEEEENFWCRRIFWDGELISDLFVI